MSHNYNYFARNVRYVMLLTYAL